MRLLRGHILRSIIGPFVFSLGACTGLLLVNQLAKQFGNLVGKDLPWQVIVEVLTLSIPFIVALTLPMAVLVAVLYGYSQLGADNEITAMRASGLSVMQMLRPALVAGILMMLISFVFVDQVLPRTNARLGNLQTDIGQKKPAFQMREQAINQLPPYFVRAGRVYPGSGRLTDVEIFDLSLATGRRVVYADSGVMAFDERGVDLALTLYTGKVHEYITAEPSKIRITHFDRNLIRVKNVQNMFDRDTANFHRGDREMTTCEMMDQVSYADRRALVSDDQRYSLAVHDLRNLMRLKLPIVEPGPVPDVVRHCGRWRVIERAIGRVILPQVATAQEPAPVPATTPAGQDTAAIDSTSPGVVAAPIPDQTAPPAISTLGEVTSAAYDGRQARVTSAKFKVEIHKKYAISVACLTFVLIGVALALRFPRGGMGLVIGGGLSIFAVFYVGLVGGEALADRGYVKPALVMWAPNAVVLLVGLIGLFRVNREFGSTRGGDFADLLDTLTRPFRRKPKAA